MLLRDVAFSVGFVSFGFDVFAPGCSAGVLGGYSKQRPRMLQQTQTIPLAECKNGGMGCSFSNMTDPQVAEPAEAERELDSKPRRAWWRERWFIIGVAAVVAVSLASGWVAEYFTAQGVVDTKNSQIVNLDRQLASSNVQVAKYQATDENQLATVQQAKQDEADLKAGQAQLAKDQAALAAQTAQVQASSFSDGQYVVGQNLAPGVYSQSAGGDCYYQWASSTASDASIIANEIPQGPSQVNLRSGDVFSASNCGTWTKIG